MEKDVCKAVFDEASAGVEIIEICDGFIVISKGYGILSEDGADGELGVPSILAGMLSSMGFGRVEIYTVHRLDRTTEGLMIYATDKRTAALLSRAVSGEGAIAGDVFEKTYAAYAVPSAESVLEAEGEMVDYLYFDRRTARSYPAKKEKRDAKKAVLTYRLTDRLEYRGNTVWRAEVNLKTGRTHQIRSQFSIRKAPLLGDGKYGCRVNYKGASLFSVRLRLVLGGVERVWEREGERGFD